MIPSCKIQRISTASAREYEKAELDRQDVFALKELNTNDFGTVIIMSDGKVYANVNNESIGNINESIRDILCQKVY